ncbi:MAG: nucleotide exchange factor GrpE [Opitutales bacterium]
MHDKKPEEPEQDKTNEEVETPEREVTDAEPVEGAEDVSSEAEAEPARVEVPTDEAEDDSSELEKARREASEMKTHYFRAVADLENFRKRIAREKQEIIRSAAADVIEALLPVLDNLRLGLQSAENHPEAKEITTGFKMVEAQFKQVLSEQGLEEIKPDGDAFDPNLHECISHQPSDEVPDHHVIETVRSGYRLNDRLIRPANVIVSSGSDENEAPAPENS